MPSIVLPQRPAFARSHPSYIVVSTYQLESSTERAGSLYFLSSSDLSTIHVHPTPAGVFRFQFPSEQRCVAALTNGNIYSVSLKDFSAESVEVSSDMLLDVSCQSSSAVATDNKGRAFHVDLDTATILSSWLGHQLPFTGEPCEVWTCALNEEHDICCTGGEDALLRVWDLRATGTAAATSKIFEAGVTYTRWMDDKIILTGSYDQVVRVLDTRNMKGAVKEIHTAGGVWNIEESCFDGKTRNIAACMYGGWSLFDADFDVTQRDEPSGKELLYGATMVACDLLCFCTFNDFTVSLVNL